MCTDVAAVRALTGRGQDDGGELLLVLATPLDDPVSVLRAGEDLRPALDIGQTKRRPTYPWLAARPE